MVYCTTCGTDNPAGSDFCVYCGSKMDKPAKPPTTSESPEPIAQPTTQISQPVVHTTPVSQPGTHVTPVAHPEPVYAAPVAEFPTSNKHELKRGRKDPYLAFVVSMVIPGFGSMYVGRILEGIIIFIAVILMLNSGFGILTFFGILAWGYNLYYAKQITEKFNIAENIAGIAV